MNLWHLEKNRCKGCELCVEFCPPHCLAMHEGLNTIGYHPAFLAQPDQCTGCGLCGDMCPESAIRVYRRRKAKSKPEPKAKASVELVSESRTQEHA